MVTTTAYSSVVSRTSAALRTLKKMPLIQSGMALVISSAVTSGLGLVFWIVATNRFTPAEVGISSALITSMILLADFAHLGLRTGLIRFLPIAGAETERLVIRAYAVAAIGAAVGAGIFVAGLDWWSPELTDVRQSWGSVLLFVLATVFWVLFLLEDSVLLGVRLAFWVPIENGLFGLAKIVLLLVLAGAGGDLGVFLAWSIPVFIVVLIVNGLIVRTVRARPTESPRTGPPLTMRTMLGYSLTDWSASAARTAVIGVLPLLVLARQGSEATAYYILAWTIAFSVYILSANIGDALVAEASYDEGNVDRHTLHSGLLSMAISAPVVVAAVVAAPWIMGVFGSEYADNGTTVLRLLLLGAIPNVVTRTYVSRLRAERRMAGVVAYETALSVAVIALGWLLIGSFGIDGLGLTWLLCLAGAALYAMTVESVWWWAPRLDTRTVRAITWAGCRLRELDRRRPVVASRKALNEVVGQLYATKPSWRRERFSSQSQTVLVAGHEGRPPLQVEVARTRWGGEILGKRVAAIAGLGELTGLSSFRALLPYPIEHQVGPGPTYLVESAHSGRLGHELAGEVPVDELVAEVMAAISQLHEVTSDLITMDDRALERWVSRPVRELRQAGSVPPDQLQRIEEVMCTALTGTVVPSARLHGNLVLSNTRFDSSNHLTGITRWEWSETGPVLLDRGALAFSARAAGGRLDLGAVVAELLHRPEQLWADSAFEGYEPGDVDPRGAVLLCWLHLLGPAIRGPVASNPGRYWFARSVRTVVSRLPAADPAPA
jgi:O-antigen/teichoic acid export membrane protein